MAIAFFDLDRTLLAANSGRLWLRRELKLGHISRWQALDASLWLLRYGLGLSALEPAVRKALAMIQGMDERAMRERSDEFYARHIRMGFRPGGLAAIERHRGKGDRLVLLTASSLYLAERAAGDLRLDGVLCNRLETDDRGRFTGRTLGGVCFGAGKLEHAQAYADAARTTLGESSFYTDSYSDLPVLTAMGHPVAVNPDGRLRREALRRGWPVVDWGEPGQVH